MKTKIIILFISLCVSSSLIAQDEKLIPFYAEPEFGETILGFMDSNGEVVIPAGKYSYIFPGEFDKIAFVGLKGKQGIFAIDRSEQVLFQVHSSDNGPDLLSNGLFRIIENGKMGFANMAGEVVIKPAFDFIFPFQENGLAIFNEGGERVKDGEYHRQAGGKWGAINQQGERVIPAVYEEGGTKTLKKEGTWYRVNNQHELVMEQ